MRNLHTDGLPRKAIPRASVNKRAVKGPATRPLTESLLTVYNSGTAGCYARTQKEEEVHGEPRRAGDRHSRLCRVGTLDGTHDSHLKRKLRAGLGQDDTLATYRTYFDGGAGRTTPVARLCIWALPAVVPDETGLTIR